MDSFKASIEIIGINPFVFVPDGVLQNLWEQAGTSKGPVPVRGCLNGSPYRQTLVKFKGYWCLYINMVMLPHSPRRVGEEITLTLAYDPVSRTPTPPQKWLAALAENAEAEKVFKGLAPSRQAEIVRTLARLKTEAALTRNIKRAIAFLLGRERFAGRNAPPLS